MITPALHFFEISFVYSEGDGNFFWPSFALLGKCSTSRSAGGTHTGMR